MARRGIGNGLTALAALAGFAGVAAAQAPTVPADPPPAGTLEAPPERIEPRPPVGAPGAQPPGGTLSDQLEESRGVIKPPPGLDPGLVEEPPDPGLFPTPVIPPGTQTPGAQPR